MMVVISNTQKLTFSAHDSIHYRQLWLKKGYDFIKEGYSFKDDAVIQLGVGKNIISTIRFWMKAFKTINDKGNPIEFGISTLSHIEKI